MAMRAAAGDGSGGAGDMAGDSMGGGMVSPSSTSAVDAMTAHDHHRMGGGTATSTHMTFFWSKDVQILFSGWPGDRPGVGMYLLALLSVFVASAAVDGLSSLSKRLARGSSSTSAADERHGGRRVPAALLLTAVHAMRLVLAYLVMLAVMSFNVGVLVAAVAGHAVGFLLSGSGLFERRKDTDSIRLNNSHISVSKF